MATAGRVAASSTPATSSSTARSSGSEIAGTVARGAIGAERPAMAEGGQTGQGQRQDPVARAAARVRDEPDAAGIVLVARVVERGPGIATIGVHWQVSGGDDAAAVGGTTAAAGGRWRWASAAVGTREEPVPTSRYALPSGLIGGFAVDRQVQTHLLRLRLDPESEEEADDLDDDERADDRVARWSPRRR